MRTRYGLVRPDLGWRSTFAGVRPGHQCPTEIFWWFGALDRRLTHLAREYVTAAVRGPKRIVKTDKTPMLEAVEWRKIE